MPTVLISGAARGLGLALANAFQGIGATVCRGVRNQAGPQDFELNVRSRQSCENAVRRVVAENGGIDILINNAGLHLGGPVLTLDQDAFKELLDVNLLGVWRLTKAAVPHMRPGGTVVMISSLSGLVGLPDDGAYAASKFALEGLSQSLAAELAPLGLRVLLFEPGRIATGFAGNSDGLAPNLAAYEIVQAILRPDTPLRSPVGADASHVFKALGVDSGPKAENLVRTVTGRDWQVKTGEDTREQG